MIGDIYENKTPISAYQPSKEIADFTALVKKDYGIGYDILHREWPELNDMSVIGRMNRDQKTFNAFVDESVEDPNEAWKWRGTRSMARNKAMAMHAHLTTGYIRPGVNAQNLDGEEDRGMADIMDTVTEWMSINSSYRSSFLLTSMGMLVNPVTYMGADYAEVYQTIKLKTTEGYSTKEVVDEILSGFQAPVLSADQVLITNAYEQNIQKQRAICKPRFIDYTEAEAKYGKHENWQFVQKGIRSLYNEGDGLFYDVKDEEHPTMVEETTYLNRRDDTEVCFINGIYMGEEQVENNPIRHRDNRSAPKYNVVPFGYHRINEHFFYYKSLMNVMGWDNQLMDATYEYVMNRNLLDLAPPTAISGEDNLDTSIMFPGAVFASANENFKAQQIMAPASGNAYRALEVVEQSLSDDSVSDTQSGQLPEASQKAFSVAQAAQNAQTVLSGVSKPLGESVAQYGQLMIDIAIQHLTVPQLDQLLGDTAKMKYRQFVIPNKTVAGKNVSKRVKFDEGLMSYDMTDEQKTARGTKLLEDIGWPDHKEHVFEVNPRLFAAFRYYASVEPETMFPKNAEYQQALMNQLYTLLRADPLVSPEGLVRKLLYAYFRGEGEDLIAEAAPQIMGAGQPAAPQQAPGSQLGAMAQSKGLGGALAGASPAGKVV